MQNFKLDAEANRYNLLSQLAAAPKAEALDTMLQYYRIIKLLGKYGECGETLRLKNCAIFKDAELSAALKAWSAGNSRLMPVKELMVEKNIMTAEDWSSAGAELSGALEALAGFQQEFNLSVKLIFQFKAFEAPVVLKLLELLLERDIAAIEFRFDFPALPYHELEQLKNKLHNCQAHPAWNDSRVSFSNFPFCLLSAAQFRQWHRETVKPLKGKIELQKQLLSRLQQKPPVTFKPCARCRCKVACHAFSDIGKHPQYAKILEPREQNTLIFAGASLKPGDCPQDPDLLLTRPVEQGDLLAAILEGFTTILIIDGYFYHKYPCTPLEIVLALEQGIAVFGCSSIGALRAVELDGYGMTGTGFVYAYLKKRKVKPYHIVAQLYNEANQSLSLPLVDIFFFLHRAKAAGKLNPGEYAAAVKTANRIDFLALSFERFFQALPSALGARLRAFLQSSPPGAFNVKRLDALELLRSFKSLHAAQPRGHSRKILLAAQARYRGRLLKKYNLTFDRSLPSGWRRVPQTLKISAYTRDRREQYPPRETCRLAEKFFKDLDIVLSDTSKYDPFSHNYIINAYFITLYFLDYYLASSFGNGDIYEEALVSAFMELLERITMMSFPLKALPPGEASDPFMPFAQLPQYYNWAIPAQSKTARFNASGWLKVSDILSDKTWLVPKCAVLGATSGSDGNASGNTLVEATLYGILEVIERDIVRTYNAVPNSLQARLVLNPDDIEDTKARSLIRNFKAKACDVLLLNLVNIYDLPCVSCLILDRNLNLIRKGGIAVRCDFNQAVSAALLEAFSLYLVDFTGGRDDYVSIIEEAERFQGKRFQLAYANFLNRPQYFKPGYAPEFFNSLLDELDYVTAKLTRAGIKNLLVADLSPLERYKLKSVKVIIPGTDLVFISPYQASRTLKAKVKKTIALVAKHTQE